ncbi:MAG: ATP-binding cassette domain-containing protein [Chloroflexia bacterium]|nr:ATP-binding cassette domain-containing protein [Chloroflexia bacterium]
MAAVDLRDVRVWTPERVGILNGITWRVGRGEQWALLGPNGSGKSTLLSIAAAARHPSAGEAWVLDGRFGKTDMAALRARIGVVDPSQKILAWLTAEDVVLTGLTATIRPLWERYGPADRERARQSLALVGGDGLAERPIATCSQGERQRVRIARALMNDPDLLLLDEPAFGLDLPAREALIAALVALHEERPNLACILVTHHLEELPPTTGHALLLRSGALVAAGPIRRVLTSDRVSECFGIPVEVEERHGRWTARSAGGWLRSGAPAAERYLPAPPLDDDEGF